MGNTLRTPNDLDENDFRRTLPRFAKDSIANNARFSESLARIAGPIGISASQLAIAWVLHRGENVVAIPGTKRLNYLKSNFAAGGIALTPDVLRDLDELLHKIPIDGTRYTQDFMRTYGLDR